MEKTRQFLKDNHSKISIQWFTEDGDLDPESSFISWEDCARMMKLYKDSRVKWRSETPKTEGDYLCRMSNAYVKMCHWTGVKWLDMWDTNLKGSVREWTELI